MSARESITAVLVKSSRIEWTTIRWRKQQTEIVPVKHVDWDPPEQPAERDAKAVEQLKAVLSETEGTLTAIVPSERVLIRVVDLPSTDPTELAAMVDLQVDKFAPFPLEHMAIGHEVIGGTGASSRVLIAACRREVVTELGALFETAGRPVDRMDVAASAWWQLLRDQGALPLEGRHGLILLDATGCELIITQNGLPVLIRSLEASEDATDAGFYTELSEETAYTLTSLESEWGSMAAPELVVWYRDHLPEGLLDALRSGCGIPVSSKSLDALPPLTEGAARRSAGNGKNHPLDLSPREWKEAATARRGQRRLLTIAASLLVAWGAMMAVFFLLSHLEGSRIERLRADINAMEGPAEEARLLRRRVESLEQYADRTYSALEVLREITELLPSGVELTSFTYRKAGAVNVRGESERVPPIYDFFEAMEQSALFVEVKPEGVTQAPGGRRRPEFRLTARLPGEGAP